MGRSVPNNCHLQRQVCPAPCQFRRIAAKVGKPFNQSLVQPAANATEEPSLPIFYNAANVRYHFEG